MSLVLEAFAAGAAAGDPDRAEAIQREAESAEVDREEKDLMVRALTAASRSASKAAGEEPRKSLIKDGDAAFDELNTFKPLTSKAQPVLASHSELLHLASESIGPYPGGRVGHVKDPAGRPAVVDTIEPTPSMQEELARRAGRVVGLAGALLSTDTVAEVRALSNGCPVCGAPTGPTAGNEQELAAGTADPISEKVEFGECEVKHKLKRPAGTGRWEAVGRDELFASDPFDQGQG